MTVPELQAQYVTDVLLMRPVADEYRSKVEAICAGENLLLYPVLEEIKLLREQYKDLDFSGLWTVESEFYYTRGLLAGRNESR